MNDYSYGWNDESPGAYHGMYYNGPTPLVTHIDYNNYFNQRLYDSQRTPTISSWYPSGYERFIDIYAKTCPNWLDNTDNANKVLRVGSLGLIGTELGAPAGAIGLAVSGVTGLGTTLTQSLYYQCKPAKEAALETGLYILTDGVANQAMGALKAAKMGKDVAAATGGIKYSSQLNRYYTIFKESKMWRFVDDKTGLAVNKSKAYISVFGESISKTYNHYFGAKNQKK